MSNSDCIKKYSIEYLISVLQERKIGYENRWVDAVDAGDYELMRELNGKSGEASFVIGYLQDVLKGAE